MEKFKTKYTTEPVCPYCGKEQRDTWELQLRNDEDIDITCGYCENEFNVLCSISVEYSTFKHPCKVHKLDLDEYSKLFKEHKNFQCIDCDHKFYDWDLADGRFPKLKKEQYIFVGDAKNEN